MYSGRGIECHGSHQDPVVPPGCSALVLNALLYTNIWCLYIITHNLIQIHYIFYICLANTFNSIYIYVLHIAF